MGNLRVRVPATKGRESAPTVILQGHLDMVCVRDPTAGPYDPAKGKIRVFRATKKGDTFVETKTGEWIKADKTTLGADDGIGVAAMLTVVEDKAAVHGPLELLFTVDEETGLTGAFQLDPSLITGKTCLNLDSEEDDSIIIGSAGGRNTTITWSRKLAATPPQHVGVTLKISGLRGGHSGGRYQLRSIERHSCFGARPMCGKQTGGPSHLFR